MLQIHPDPILSPSVVKTPWSIQISVSQFLLSEFSSFPPLSPILVLELKLAHRPRHCVINHFSFFSGHNRWLAFSYFRICPTHYFVLCKLLPLILPLLGAARPLLSRLMWSLSTICRTANTWAKLVRGPLALPQSI